VAAAFITASALEVRGCNSREIRRLRDGALLRIEMGEVRLAAEMFQRVTPPDREDLQAVLPLLAVLKNDHHFTPFIKLSPTNSRLQ
jgi:hypothetical protein